jgi:TonB-linked SusC/RagA family outer membrane protein
MAALFCVGVGLSSGELLAQTGSVTGTVLNAETGEPLETVQISLEHVGDPRPGLGGLTRSSGRYLVVNVPSGQYVLRAELIGFATLTYLVEVTAGEATVLDFRLEPEPVSISEVVVTGVVGATQRSKLPFDVVQIRVADLPVPTVTAAQSIQGKAAGVHVVSPTGIPGTSPDILLRGVTSLNAMGRSQDPLYIVDGVILGADMVDISALDIQSIEVVKGAAAASLYGSRAGNGVIQIRTKRGAEMAEDQVRYTFRSEYGRSELGRKPEDYVQKAHPWAMTPDQQYFIDLDGTPCAYMECEGLTYAGQAAGGDPPSIWNSFQSNPFPGKTYDQLERFFTHGDYFLNGLSIEGRSGRTNFLVSGNYLDQGGVVRFLPGFKRMNFRLNLDQAVREDLTLHASAFYGRSSQPMEDWVSGALNGLMYTSPMADLLAEDPDRPGELVFYVDRDNGTNPLYNLQVSDDQGKRSRFLGAATLRFTPRDWVRFDGNLSFDRADNHGQNLLPKGYRTETSWWLEEGAITLSSETIEAVNGSLTASFDWEPAPRVWNITQARYLVERQDFSTLWTEGLEFAVGEVPVLGNVNPETITARSSTESIRADAYFLLTNFDIDERFVIDGLIRNDGSSLFGEDERRHWYYRLGGAWRISQEGFFRVPHIDEWKLRYSIGTAGGRPGFPAQYETFRVSQGRVSPYRLGNREIQPEFSTEHEAGFDLSAFDFGAVLSLTYAQTSTENQILLVPQPSFSGYLEQWRNAGTVESKTWEATLDMRLVERPTFNWRARVLFDRTRSTITEMDAPPFKYGGGPYGGTQFLAREGEEVGTFFGIRAARGCGDLPAEIVETVGCEEFAVNDDGLLVWIGPGGNLLEPSWGADGPVVGGRTVKWGTPFAGVCIDRVSGEETGYCPLGNTIPGYNLGLSTTLTWRGLSAYALVTRSSDFDVQYWDAVRGNGLADQVGVPAEDLKPVGYYDAWYDISGGSGIHSLVVHDGSFTKLREVALSYEIGPDLLGQVSWLGGLTSMSLTLTGQNLLTWTDYPGSDPDVGLSGGQTGSAVVARIDSRGYPHMRTFTGAVKIVF